MVPGFRSPVTRRPQARRRGPLVVALTALTAAGLTAAPAGATGAARTDPAPAASAAHAPGPAAPARWTGAWSVSPQPGGPSYRGRTLRQIVHTSIGGTAARIRLSNVFGTAALTVSDVHLARRTSGPSVDTGTDRPLTFRGRSTVTIPAGADAVSDPAAFGVPAGSDVAVSFYLPAADGPATFHRRGYQTNYAVAGDASARGTLAGAATDASYSYLTNLDVRNPVAEGALVALGASLTDGTASRTGANRRWPDDLARRLSASGRTIGVLNQGISGNRLLADGAGPSALRRFDRDVLGQPGVRWVVFSDDPLNDVGSTRPTPTGARLVSGLRQLIVRAHRAGLFFACATLTPFQGAGYWTPAGEDARAAFNAFVRGPHSGCDAVADEDAATHDPAHPARFLPAYDSGDHLHPDEAGLQAIADAVHRALFAP